MLVLFVLTKYFPFRFLSVSSMNLKAGVLSFENLRKAFVSMDRQPKLEFLKGTLIVTGLRISRIRFSLPS